MLLVEFFDGEFQLVAFFQIKPLADFFWNCDLPAFSEVRVAFHRTHYELFALSCIKGCVLSASTPGSSPGAVALYRLYKGYLSMASGETFVAVWIGILGAVLLGMAYLIISDKATVAYEELRTRV